MGGLHNKGSYTGDTRVWTGERWDFPDPNVAYSENNTVMWNGEAWVDPKQYRINMRANTDFVRHGVYLLIFIIVTLVLALART